MLKILQNLCNLNGTSGNEDAVREYILGEIGDCAQCEIDAMGNIIANKQGKKTPERKIMLDAHMDEVGFIITAIDDDGFLSFETVGGIDISVLLSRRIIINNKISGVIGCKPVHLCKGDAAKKYGEKDSLYIDIGAENRDEVLECVNIGDFGVFDSDFVLNGDTVTAKAIDDRIGCAILIHLLKEDSEYDFTAVFSVQEEIGCRGARVAAYSVNPDIAFIIEATTAADIAGVEEDKQVCKLGCGPAVSFMDKATLYDRKLYNAAMNSGLACQPKSLVAGGNNSGAVHLSREGVRTMAISLPCRYIHSPSNMINVKDIDATVSLIKYMLNAVCSDLQL